MNKLNSIYLRKKSKVVLTRSNSQLDAVNLATILKNIESLGYTFSPQLIDRLSTLSEPEASLFYSQLVTDLKQALGAVEYAPMYPNFPAQVMEMVEAELYLNAITHYLGDVLEVRILPQYNTESRSPLSDSIKLKIIELGTESELLNIFRNLLRANTSLSETDKQDLRKFISTFPNLTVDILPEQFGYKENLAYVASLLHQDLAKLQPYFKTASDVLRLATAMSDGDISLAENTRFRNFNRRERRLLLELLEQCDSIAEDMLRYKNRWIRLGEKLHPFEYRQRYPKCYRGFDVVRNDKPVATFNSSLETAFTEQRWHDAIELLSTRPGEFARRLDFLLRNIGDREVIKSRWVSDRVSTPVLLQVANHFQHRNGDYPSGTLRERDKLRVFFPKGNVAKAFAIENELPEINSSVCQEVVEICERTLIDRFAKLAPLGKVYIDPELKKFPIPFAGRSASKSLRQLTRGSRLPIGEGNTVRFFMWWKESVATGTVDIDLSAVMYDADWNYLEHISWTNLKSAKYRAAHSGDFTSAPDGASEFIDLDLASILNYGGRYVVASVLSFTNQPFSELPECFAGWMIRQNPNSGEIYEPQTVRDKVDLTANSAICIPAIIDLQQREIVWTDMSLSRHPSWGIVGNNVETSQNGIALIGKAITDLQPPTLEQLFKLHARARGELVSTAEQADSVFSIEQGITPFDLDAIAAGFLV